MDVVGTWTGRHASALLKAFRLTNEGFAEKLGTSVRGVAKWNANPTLEQSPEMQMALDTLLSTAPPDVQRRFAMLLKESDNNGISRQEGSSIRHSPTELIASITESNTRDEAIEQLERATMALAEAHTQSPAGRVLKQVLQLHSQAQGLLAGKQRLSQRRDLFRIESEVLAHTCLLLGDLKENQRAEEYGRAALVYAQEAGSNEAIAWTALAKTLRWAERFAESADMARQGFVCSPPSPVKIQLASQEANAAALIGDSKRAREALRRSEETAAIAPQDSGLSAWSFPTPRQAIFALSVATETGDADTAIRAAERADAAWAAGEPQVPATWAQIRAGAAIAHLLNGSLEGTVEEVTPVLAMPPTFRVSTVTAYIDRLYRRLEHGKFTGSKVAIELRENLREFSAGALPPD